MERIFAVQQSLVLECVKIENAITNRHANTLGAVFPMTPKDSKREILHWEIAALNIGGLNPTLYFWIMRLVE
jgi:hypothetical protein